MNNFSCVGTAFPTAEVGAGVGLGLHGGGPRRTLKENTVQQI